MIELVLGGARSGKSALAEQLARESGKNVLYVATATPSDGEMAERIARHRARRPGGWRLLEEPLRLASAIRENTVAGQCIIVDCMTLWLNNLMFMDEGRHLEDEKQAFVELLQGYEEQLILVSNEVGMGIVPMGEISRRFQDESGWLNQAVAGMSDRVILTVAGLPHVLKGERL